MSPQLRGRGPCTQPAPQTRGSAPASVQQAWTHTASGFLHLFHLSYGVGPRFLAVLAKKPTLLVLQVG